MQSWQLWTSRDAIKTIHNIEPRLASWEKRTHPAQVRLQSYLDQLVAAIMPLPPQPQPLFLHLDIDVGVPERLVRHHDLENYLTPLFGRRWLDPSRFVLVSARKQVGEGSRLIVGVAQPQTSALQGWEHFTCLAGIGTQTKQWKVNLRTALANAKLQTLPAGPVEVQLAWQCAPHRNWVNLWKPTGDAMEPILGAASAKQSFSPYDDRIVTLILHRNVDPGIGQNVVVGMWW